MSRAFVVLDVSHVKSAAARALAVLGKNLKLVHLSLKCEKIIHMPDIVLNIVRQLKEIEIVDKSTKMIKVMQS